MQFLYVCVDGNELADRMSIIAIEAKDTGFTRATAKRLISRPYFLLARLKTALLPLRCDDLVDFALAVVEDIKFAVAAFGKR